jgi:RNA polymerase sigma-70 factor (ECF subfamily)
MTREAPAIFPQAGGNILHAPAVYLEVKPAREPHRMNEGDRQRFERVVLPYLDDAYTLARYLLRDEHDAQDVVQEASLRALRSFDGYQGGDARAWLLAIVRNCSLSWRKRQRIDSARHVPDADDVPLMSASEADSAAIASSEQLRVQRAIDALPNEFREVVVLREVQDLSYREICDVIGVPMGTVMSRLARARKRLATLLGVDAREAS